MSDSKYKKYHVNSTQPRFDFAMSLPDTDDSYLSTVRDTFAEKYTNDR